MRKRGKGGKDGGERNKKNKVLGFKATKRAMEVRDGKTICVRTWTTPNL